MSKRYACAIVTGASSGLGREFVCQLAADCQELILVARREDRLRDLAAELEGESLRVQIFPCDLTDEAQRESLLAELEKLQVEPDLVINNAGMGDYGDFRNASWQKTKAMMVLNMEALTHLSHAFLEGLIRQKGALINVSSLGGDLPIPDFAVYAATKSYVTSFSEALRIELREHEVRVMALCPGPVSTEFGDTARRNEGGDALEIRKAFYVDAPRVVAGALRALDRGRARHYPGVKVAVMAGVLGLLPAVALRALMSSRPRKAK